MKEMIWLCVIDITLFRNILNDITFRITFDYIYLIIIRLNVILPFSQAFFQPKLFYKSIVYTNT